VDAKVILDDKMAFYGSADSGFTMKMDASTAGGGDDTGFRPLELLLVGLGGCTAMDVVSILRKKRQDISGFEIQLHADRAHDHPKVFTAVTLNYIVRGHNVDPKAVERAIELSATKYCSAEAMLAKTAKITSTYQILEEK
jgi:putative redox protein